MTTHEAVHADLRSHPVHVAVPPSECLNGCQRGTGPERAPVQCQGQQLLCESCTDRVDGWLRAIPDAYALLPAVADHGTVPADPGTKHTKRPDPPAPMRLEVTDLLDTRDGRGVLGIVHAWAETIRDQRRQPARCTCGHLALGHRPHGAVRCTATRCRCHAYTPTPPTVARECALLATNLPWAIEQEWIGDLHAELRTLNRQLADTVGDYRAKPVGTCAALIERPGVPLPVLCGGALVMDRAGHGVHCTNCGTRHEANDQLRELGLLVGSLFKDNRTNQQEAS